MRKFLAENWLNVLEKNLGLFPQFLVRERNFLIIQSTIKFMPWKPPMIRLFEWVRNFVRLHFVDSAIPWVGLTNSIKTQPNFCRFLLSRIGVGYVVFNSSTYFYIIFVDNLPINSFYGCEFWFVLQGIKFSTILKWLIKSNLNWF